VLPIATTFERNDIGAGRADEYIFAMHKISEPVGQSLTDYEIFSALSEKLGSGAEFTEGRDEKGWLEHLYHRFRQSAAEYIKNVPTLDELWERGFYKFPQFEPEPFLGEFRTKPDESPLGTPSGKIEIYSSTVAGFNYEDCPGHPIWQEPLEWLGSKLTEKYPLHLITNQPKTRLHSQYDNGGYSKEHKINGREPVTINPIDASNRGISEGDIVRLFNDRGACLAGAQVSDDVMPGVIQLSTGAWFDPLEPGIPGSLDVHGNPNVLTIDKGTSSLAQGPSAMTALVEVERFIGDPPPVKIFTPPEVILEENL
jgi:biotin/methionine sulfoxide reductase